ncbi:MAG: diguanylate cyclase [Candidatus Accumulibacter sp.]|nr:diguanylate cyclase [Accumulibacter sp.]
MAGKRRILIVDGSRVVRTTLAKRLESGFSIVEEDNGESAWQRLMLDNSIIAVISSVHPPRLTAQDLLERMRTSALRRLRDTPLLLLVSDDTPEAGAGEWQRQEIAGFMTKSMSKEEMTEVLENVLSSPQTLPPSDLFDDLQLPGKPPKAHEESGEKARSRRAPMCDSLLDADAFVAAVASLPHKTGSKESLCALVFGIDRLDELIRRFGADVSDLLTGRIAKLLAAKIDPRDVLGRCGENHVAIVSHGVDLRTGVHFGKRVCKSMATGQIAVHGRKVRLTTSVGVAAMPEDGASSPEDLLTMAQERLKQAMTCGGNAVCTELRPDCPLHQREKSLLELFSLLGETLEPAQKETLGAAMRPLLREIDAKLAAETRKALGLPPLDDREADEEDFKS